MSDTESPDDKATQASEQREGHDQSDEALSRKAKGIARLLLAFTGIFLGIVISELTVRIVAPQQVVIIRPDLWQPADTVGWLHAPHANVEMNTGERTVSVATDQYGFRVSADKGRTEAERRVLVLGDSFMEALQIEHEQTTSGRLEAVLRTSIDGPIGVDNAGMAGWGLSQYTLRARQLLAQHDYDLVVTCVYMGNDIEPVRQTYYEPRPHAERPGLRLPRGLSADELTSALLLPVNNFLETRSHLYLFLRNRLGTVRMQLGLSPAYFPVHFYTAQATHERWDVTADMLKEIQDMARARGAASLTVLIPAPYQVDPASFTQYLEGFGIDPTTVDLDQPNRRLAEELAERGVTAFDPIAELRAAHEAGEQLYGRVDTHFTPKGHELLVDGFAPVAIELLNEGEHQ